MAEKTDYSPVVEEDGEAQKRRARRKWGALLAGAHVFWFYAAILAGIILLVIYLAGGFGAGSGIANSPGAIGSGAAHANEAGERDPDIHAERASSQTGPRARIRVQNDAASSA
jgi:hypothetical protein